jgi:hypothetical protein
VKLEENAAPQACANTSFSPARTGDCIGHYVNFSTTALIGERNKE